MTNKEFIELSKREVKEFIEYEYGAKNNIEIFVVWNCKTLQNCKAILSTSIGGLFETTYNGDKNEIYFDAYKKVGNTCIKLRENQ